jgi:2-polyprenyl-3-methyl-5-hydroxy-6-metoxy-1,4-benzoquinol methylase
MNAGYQKDDKRLLDYELWPLGRLLLRGPQPEVGKPYFSALGAAQTFGRFTRSPFSALLSSACGVGCLNLGISGAGPSFFLQRPEVMEVVNKGLFAIVQIMSGRSVGNSLVTLGGNQGMLIPKYGKSAAPRFAEHVYAEFLNTLAPIQLDQIRTENRAALALETIELLKRIEVPKVLIYWSARHPDYPETLTSLGGYWGGYPHFVNSQVLDAIRPFADHGVEVVGRNGLPQPLYDCHTGKPVLMWSEDAFPHVKHRYANLYYPSPEMHRQAALALEPICLELTRRTCAKSSSTPSAITKCRGPNPASDSATPQQVASETPMTTQSAAPTAFGCPYDQYDPDTLAPLNQNTILRISGLGWTEKDFKGKTVLDVGANTGLLSIQAARLGSKEIHATEVVQVAVDLIEQVAKRHVFPIRVSRKDFKGLQPVTDSADVVLFMEVIQWVMRDGDISVKDVVAKLIQLTRETLYIEFPWDANDPQIQEMTKLTHETFSANLILTELSRYFRSVQFVRFMRYFGFTHSKGNRVLIKCSSLRPEAELLSRLDDTDSLDLPLGGTVGMKRAYLLQSKTDLVIAKTIRSGPFSKLSSVLQTKVFEELADGSPKHIVLPIKAAGRFVTRSGGEDWMLFPFVGAITGVGELVLDFSPAEIIATARQVSVELNAVSSSTMAALQNQDLSLHLSSYKRFTSEFLKPIFEIPWMQAVFEAALAHPTSALNTLIHHDLHAGNMIRDNEAIRVIDLDSMQLGTIGTDLVNAAIWYNCSAAEIKEEFGALEQELSRQVQRSEYAYGVGIWLSWFAEASELDETIVLGRYATELCNAASYFHDRWP